MESVTQWNGAASYPTGLSTRRPYVWTWPFLVALVTPVGLQHRLKLTQARPSDIRRRVRHRIGDREAQGAHDVRHVGFSAAGEFDGQSAFLAHLANKPGPCPAIPIRPVVNMVFREQKGFSGRAAAAA